MDGHHGQLYGYEAVSYTHLDVYKRQVLRGEEGSNALDLPDRPSDLQQRDGRGVRAGNEIAKHFEMCIRDRS